MTDSGDAILAMLEESLQVARDTQAEVSETHTKVSGLELQVRSLVDKVDRHDVSLYHEDDGGLRGRIARTEDRLAAAQAASEARVQAEVRSAAEAALSSYKRLEDRVMLIWAIGGLVGGGAAMWIVGQLLGLIKP